ncbi:hypothetical protein ACQR3D_15675 [Clostridium perfringens]|nr:hypothetical protein [Clostridium perfringens]MDM0726041.1 hypothetical protein [Clostridium perfringens]
MENKEKLLKKIKFQIWKDNIEKNDDNKLYIVLNENLRETFLNNVDYFKNEIVELLNKEFISYNIVSDLADREILIIDFK